MKIKILASLGAAAMALTMSATVSQAGYMQPGETMGISLLSPLPEGVYAGDLENYGRSPNLSPGSNVGLGVNIPVLIWSTPYSFYNTRLEVLAAVPFAHLDGAGLDRVGFLGAAVGPLLAHDFGNGLTGGLGAIFHTEDMSSNIQDLSGRTRPAADFRESLQYVIPGSGPFGGITLIENAAFTSCLCSNYGPLSVTPDDAVVTVQNDMFAGDFSVLKTFQKFSFGFVGYGNIDTNNRAHLAGPNPREKNVALVVSSVTTSGALACKR